MQLQMIVLVAVGVWIALLLLVVSLCQAAKRGDEDLDLALANAPAEEPEAEAPPVLSPERPLRTLTLYHAATLLGVDPDTVLTWEARYGYPSSTPSEPRYSRSEVLALRASLQAGLSIASAVVSAREQTKRRRAVPAERLVDRRDGGIAF